MWACESSREPPLGNLWNLRMGLRIFISMKLGSSPQDEIKHIILWS
jgi:hypothetical protein